MLHHACIGVGGMMGGNDLENFLSHPRVAVTAICDVDDRHREQAHRRAGKVRTYSDWRELLAQEEDRIDSVNVTVPDHMHFPIAVSAVRAGKHVYCQKPLCHDVAEVRTLTKEAGHYGVVTQLGTQAASGIGDRMAVELLRRGVIGKIRRVILCSNRPGAIEDYRLEGPRPESGQTPPEYLDWNLWIGNAPMRPYVPEIYHPVKWRAWQDFGTGWSGDIGCHIFDAAWKGLGLTAAMTVEARVQESWRQSPARRGDTWPQSDHIVWKFPGNNLTESEELQVEWFDGRFFPPDGVRSLYPGENYPAESAMFLGSEGAMLLPHGSGPLLLPQERFRDLERPRFEPRNHYHHFAEACLGGPMTESHFAQTGPMTEAILLGTVAIRTPETRLDWDATSMRIPNHPEAESYLRRTYRDGWHY